MEGTVIGRVKYPPEKGGGNGYIIKTDDGARELWREEDLELLMPATKESRVRAIKALKELQSGLEG